MIDTLFESFEATSTFVNILWSLGIIIVFYVVKNIIIRILHNRIENSEAYYRVKRLINGINFFIVSIALIFIWLGAGANFITILGLFSAGVALALKDILLNIAGWLYILVRQPFYVGDRIEISGIKGDVIDQNLFKFRVIEIGNWVKAEQSTGRIIHIPNYKVFTDPLANYSLGFEYIWDEIAVVVTFESDWRKAKRILEKIVNHYAEDISVEMNKQIKEATRKFMIFYKSLTPIVYTDVTDSGVRLTLRFVCKPKERRQSNEIIWEAILDAFNLEEDVDIAYPTMRRT